MTDKAPTTEPTVTPLTVEEEDLIRAESRGGTTSMYSPAVTVKVISRLLATLDAARTDSLDVLRERIEALPLGHAFHDGPHTDLDPLPAASCAITSHWHQTLRRDHVLHALDKEPKP